jgi:hypothetical protein
MLVRPFVSRVCACNVYNMYNSIKHETTQHKEQSQAGKETAKSRQVQKYT